MPLFPLPDGTFMEVPTGVGFADADRMAREHYPDAFKGQQAATPAPKADPSWSGSFMRGATGLVSNTAAGGIGMFDPRQAGAQNLAWQKAAEDKYGPSAVGWDPIKAAYDKSGILGAAGEVISQVPHAVLEQIPNMAAMAGGAKLGALAGSAVAPGVGTVLGGLAGAFAPSMLQQYGSNLGRQAGVAEQQKQEFNPNTPEAVIGAMGQGALDVASGAFLLGKAGVAKLLNKPVQSLSATSAEEAVRAAQQTIKRAYGTAALKTTPVEMSTEVAQQIIERWQAGLPVLDDDALREYGHTMYATALSTPAFSTYGTYQQRGAGREEMQRRADAQAQQQLGVEEAERRQTVDDWNQRRARGLEHFRRNMAGARENVEFNDAFDQFMAGQKTGDQLYKEGLTEERRQELAYREDLSNRGMVPMEDQPKPKAKNVAPAAGDELDFFLDPERFYQQAAQDELASRDADLRGTSKQLAVKKDPLADQYEAQQAQLDAATTARKDRISQEEAALYADWVREEGARVAAEQGPVDVDSRSRDERLLDDLLGMGKDPAKPAVSVAEGKPKAFYAKEGERLRKEQDDTLAQLLDAAEEIRSGNLFGKNAAPLRGERDLVEASSLMSGALKRAEDARRKIVAAAIEEGANHRAANGLPPMSQDEALQALRIDAALREIIERSAAMRKDPEATTGADTYTLPVYERGPLKPGEKFVVDEEAAPYMTPAQVAAARKRLLDINYAAVQFNRKEKAGELTDQDRVERWKLRLAQETLVRELAKAKKQRPAVRKVWSSAVDARDATDRRLGVPPTMRTTLGMKNKPSFNPAYREGLTPEAPSAVQTQASSSLQVLLEQIDKAKRDLYGVTADTEPRTFGRRAVKKERQPGLLPTEEWKGWPSGQVDENQPLNDTVASVLTNEYLPSNAKTVFERVQRALDTNPALLSGDLRERVIEQAGRLMESGRKRNPMKPSFVDNKNLREIDDLLKQRERDFAATDQQGELFAPDDKTQGFVRANRQAFSRFMNSGKAEQARKEWDTLKDKIGKAWEEAKVLNDAFDTENDPQIKYANYLRTANALRKKLLELTKAADDASAKLATGEVHRKYTQLEKQLDELESIRSQLEAQLNAQSLPIWRESFNPDNPLQENIDRLTELGVFPEADKKQYKNFFRLMREYQRMYVSVQTTLVKADNAIEQKEAALVAVDAELDALLGVKRELEAVSLELPQVEGKLKEAEKKALAAAVEKFSKARAATLLRATVREKELRAEREADQARLERLQSLPTRRTVTDPETGEVLRKLPQPAVSDAQNPFEAYFNRQQPEKKKRGRKSAADREAADLARPVPFTRAVEQKKEAARPRRLVENERRKNAEGDYVAPKGEVKPEIAAAEAERAALERRGFTQRTYVPTGGKTKASENAARKAAQAETPDLGMGTTKAEFYERFGPQTEDDATALDDARRASRAMRDDTDFRVADGGTPRKGIDLAAAEGRVDGLVAKLRGKANVLYVSLAKNVPADVVAAAQAKGIDPALIQGAVLPDGTVLVVGENHSDMLDLERTLAHELTGHLGWFKLLDAHQKNWLKSRLENQPSEVLRLAEDLGVLEKVKNERDPNTMLKELMARVAEMRPSEKMTDRIRRFIGELIGAFRHWMRSKGFNAFSEVKGTDILFELRRAHNALYKPGLLKGTGETDFRAAAVGTEFRPLYDKLRVAAPDYTSNKAKRSKWAQYLNFMIADSKAAIQELYDRAKTLPTTMQQQATAQNAIYMTRQAEGAYNMALAVMANGAPAISYQVNQRTGQREYMVAAGASDASMAQLMRVAGRDLNDWWTYAIARRALALPDGLNRLDSSGAVTEADLRRAYEAGLRNEKFQRLDRMYADYNKGLINFLHASGYLTDAQHADYTVAADTYVPFIREIDNEIVMDLATETPIRLGAIAGSPDMRKLLGGNAMLRDFSEAATLNTMALVRAGLNNLALRNTAYALNSLGLGTIKPGKKKADTLETKSFQYRETPDEEEVQRAGENAGWRTIIVDTSSSRATDRNGNPLGTAFADIDNEMLVKGMEGVVHVLPDSVRLLGLPARFLRDMIVLNPVYAVRQLARDPQAAWLQTGANINPLKVFAKGIPQMFMERNETQRLLENRGIINNALFEGGAEDVGKVLRLIAEGKSGWESGLARLGQMHMTADLMTREAQYRSFLEQGLSEQEATLATLEGMNFRRHGQAASVQIISQLVPFVNAQIQGLSVLYRSMFGRMTEGERLKVRQKLIARGMIVAGATLAYAALSHDQPWYKNASPTSRYMNWLIPMPSFIPGLEGQALKVPIAFEPFYLFKALPEAIFNEMIMNEPGKRGADAFRAMLLQSIPGGVPIPTMFKPVLENMINYSFFTGQPLELPGMENVDRTQRYNDATTNAAKAMSERLQARIMGADIGMSPIQIENLVRGYTSSIGIGVLQLADVLMPDPVPGGKAARGVHQIPFVGTVFQNPLAGGTLQQFYDISNKLQQRAATFEKLKKEGKVEEIRQYLHAYGTEIAQSKAANKFEGELNKIKEQMNKVRFSSLSPAEKKAALDRLQAVRIQLSEHFVRRFGS